MRLLFHRLTVIIAVYSSHHHSFEYCEDASALQAFYIGMMALLICKVFINIGLIYYSSQVCCLNLFYSYLHYFCIGPPLSIFVTSGYNQRVWCETASATDSVCEVLLLCTGSWLAFLGFLLVNWSVWILRCGYCEHSTIIGWSGMDWCCRVYHHDGLISSISSISFMMSSKSFQLMTSLPMFFHLCSLPIQPIWQ